MKVKRSKPETPSGNSGGLNPLEHVEAYASQAFEFCKNGEVESAIAALGKALSLDPRNELALILRGSLWMNQGHPRKAIGDLSKALDVNSGNADAYSQRARAHQSLGHPWAAIADYSRAIRLEASHREALICLALGHRVGS